MFFCLKCCNYLSIICCWRKKNSSFNQYKFANQISKNSGAQVILVNNVKEIYKYLKNNLKSDEIVIGMGAGLISKWMRELKNLL